MDRSLFSQCNDTLLKHKGELLRHVKCDNFNYIHEAMGIYAKEIAYAGSKFASEDDIYLLT